MAFNRFALQLPYSTMDGRIHREEEVTLARITSQQQQQQQQQQQGRANNIEGSSGSAGLGLNAKREERVSRSTSPALQNKRRVVLPDPVAFKYVPYIYCR
jgi:hypothetical protein